MCIRVHITTYKIQHGNSQLSSFMIILSLMVDAKVAIITLPGTKLTQKLQKKISLFMTNPSAQAAGQTLHNATPSLGDTPVHQN